MRTWAEPACRWGAAPALLLLFTLAGCASSSERYGASGRNPADALPAAGSYREEKRRAIPPSEDNPLIDRRELLMHVMPLMGIHYEYNGSDANGFDCSGFTASVYASVLGARLPHSAQEQFGMGSPVDELRFGDLVFFATEGEGPSHVGIYVGDGLFAHASSSLGVTVSLMKSGYYRTRYIGARRIIR